MITRRPYISNNIVAYQDLIFWQITSQIQGFTAIYVKIVQIASLILPLKNNKKQAKT